MNRNRLLIIGAGVIVLATAAIQFAFPRTAVSPIVTEPQTTTATTTAPTTAVDSTPALNVTGVTVSTSVPATQKLPSIAKGDTIASWDFKGAYADVPDLTLKAQVEIARLSSFVGEGTYPDVTLYVGIANQYDLLGDGKQEYAYLGRAIEADGAISGLPWHNLGVLMERLGALETARVAYEKATLVQPLKQWYYAYLEFLTTRMKDDIVDIEKTFATAQKNIGQQDEDLLQLYTEWKNASSS
ncbi:MAG: tetratricopeptide repeat protein [Patescibacteria group bacterium]|nr:tetratricopeptide repeat protein [Patescibacteria group bacterium]